MQRFMLPSVQTVECVKPAPNIYISLLQDIILHCGSCNGYHQAGQGFTVVTTAALHRIVQCQCTTSCYASTVNCCFQSSATRFTNVNYPMDAFFQPRIEPDIIKFQLGEQYLHHSYGKLLRNLPKFMHNHIAFQKF